MIAAFVSAVLFIDYKKKPEQENETKPASNIAEVGLPAPDFELKDPDGRLWRLSDMKGAVVFVNFWATWCAPCIEEMPSIQKLYEKTKDNPEFRLLTVLFRDDPKNAYLFMTEKKYTFPLLIDPDGSVARSYGLTGVPETYIIDKKGALRGKTIGPENWDSPGIIDNLNRISSM
jgi:peroxiredoxin